MGIFFFIGLTLTMLVGFTTDQILTNVYDPTNTALRANVVAGGGGSVGPGTVNNLAKFTPSTTTIGNSAITDDGSGAIGIYPAAAAPQATTWTFASATGADHAGANQTIKLSGSTGSGLGGNIAFQNTNKAGTGSAANTYGNVLTLSPPNTGTTAPVNYVDIKNAITGAGPTISSLGSDTNIDITMKGKGTGNTLLDTSSASGYVGLSSNGTLETIQLASSFRPATDGGAGLGVSAAGWSVLALSSAAQVIWNNDTALVRANPQVIQMGINQSGTPATYTLKGANTTTNGSPGAPVIIQSGNGLTTGAGGAITVKGGTSGSGGAGGAATFGGALSAGTDIAAGLTSIQGGIATGAAVPGPIKLQTGSVLASGTTAQTLVDRYDVGVQKVLANNTVTPMVSFTMANNTVVAGNATYSCQVFDGTELQIEEGEIVFHETNKGNTPANNTVVKYGNQQAMTSGTLTVTWTITAASPAVLSVNCNSSLTPSTGYPILTYAFHNLTNQAAAIQ